MKINPNCYYSILNRKPLQQVPKELIYTLKAVATDFTTGKSRIVNVHNMADTATGHYVGQMVTQARKKVDCTYIYPNKITCDALEIIRLIMEERRMGYGSKFIEFAKHESRKKGCEGRVFALASRLYDRNHPSHIFYRKKGFTSVNPKINKILDECIEQGKDLDIEYADNLFMYLPVKEKPSKVSRVFQKIKNFIKNLFNHNVH